MSAVPLLHLQDIRIAYRGATGTVLAVDGVSLALEAGAIGCLLGPSGCGKTSVLRAIAGFEPLHGGRIGIAGVKVAGAGAPVPPERRRVGMMFQDHALFPHLDVAANVGFGLRGLAAAAARARVAEMLALVGLEAQARRHPHELSGGQQQRVALARALAPAPALLLLDEPFSSLDARTREHVARELRGLLRATATTALMVSHDQAEAFAMADRIGVMDAGRLLQWGAAEDLYRAPADPFVAGFIGRGALVAATALGLEGGGQVLLRPDRLRPDPAGPLQATVAECVFRGPGRVALLALDDGTRIEVDLPATVAPSPGEKMRVSLVPGPQVRFPLD